MDPEEAKVPIVGVGSDGLAGLTARARDLLLAADLVLGAEPVLRLLPELPGQRYRIGADLLDALETVRANLGRKRLAVVAGGDPLFYGVARYLCDRLGKDRFEVLPHVSSMQLAFARIKETWEEAYLTDLTAHPLAEVLDRIRLAERVGLFTGEAYGPERVARDLLASGIDQFRAYVCENLGGPNERITQGDLADLEGLHFGPLNVVVLVRKPNRPAPDRPRPPRRFGNPDSVFVPDAPPGGTAMTPSGALVTQGEIRALALAELDLRPGGVLWDVGAGSGSVSLEAASLVAPGTVYAVEQDPGDYQLLAANVESFGLRNVRPLFGSAPDVLRGLPSPDAVFIGGTGREVAQLLEATFTALKPSGRLVVNVATLEMLGTVYAALKALAPPVNVLLVNVARGVEQLETLRFEAVNPTFLLGVRKRGDAGARPA